MLTLDNLKLFEAALSKNGLTREGVYLRYTRGKTVVTLDIVRDAKVKINVAGITRAVVRPLPQAASGIAANLKGLELILSPALLKQLPSDAVIIAANAGYVASIKPFALLAKIARARKIAEVMMDWKPEVDIMARPTGTAEVMDDDNDVLATLVSSTNRTIKVEKPAAKPTAK